MKALKKFMPRFCVVVGLLALWQILYLLNLFPDEMFPSVFGIFGSLAQGFREESLGVSTLFSLSFIFRGMLFGTVLALIFSALSMCLKFVHLVYTTLISLFDSLPGMALVPLAILWFGTGEFTIVMLIIHSVVWPLSRSILDGYATVPAIYLEAGRNYGLKRLRLVGAVYVPASMPSFLSGLKTGWARAWRALISAEMVFSVTTASGVGGVGWYIFAKRYQLDTEAVLASLLLIIFIGLVLEYGVFGFIERRTVKKWGSTR